jgi:2-haloacid dehalogenase
MDYERFTHLTFDCYGTLIDWERGILGVAVPLLEQRGATVEAVSLLREYARLEAEEERGAYRPYREVLRAVMRRLGEAHGVTLSDQEAEALPASVGSWPPFPDTVEALRALKSRYRLVILSNIDDAMFAETNRLLGVEFDTIITAEQVGSYKPAPNHFTTALERTGARPEQVLHVAQSLYHDHAPAKARGWSTVWVNRSSLLPGQGLALPTAAQPDVEVPDLATLVREMTS